jgi:hypothetical protein
MVRGSLPIAVVILVSALSGDAVAQALSQTPVAGDLAVAALVDACKGGSGGGGGGDGGGGGSGGGSGGGGRAGGAVGGGAGGVGSSDGLSPQDRARAFALRAVYFRREAYRSTVDCLTAAYARHLPIDLCQ